MLVILLTLGTGIAAGHQRFLGNLSAVHSTEITSGYVLCGTGQMGLNIGKWVGPHETEITPGNRPVYTEGNLFDYIPGYVTLKGVADADTTGLYTCEIPDTNGVIKYHTVALYPETGDFTQGMLSMDTAD